MIDVLRAVQRCYDEVADTYADHFPSTEPEQPVDLAMIAHFAALLGEGRRVLDAGCGAGRMMPLLAGLGCEVRGVDLSPGMVRRGRVDHPEFDIEVASLIDLPFGDGEVDGVFAWYSTIHTPDAGLPGVLAELGRVLRHDGLLLLAFQTGHGVREVGAGFRQRGHDVQLDRYHRSAADIARMLGDGDFRVVATLDRGPVGAEADGQPVVIARKR